MQIVATAARARRAGETAHPVVRQLLERVRRRGALRIETVPARWPLTRHRVRALAEVLVEQGLLARLPGGAVRITTAGLEVLAR